MPLLSKKILRSRDAKHKEALEEAAASFDHHQQSSPPPSYTATNVGPQDYADPPVDLTAGFAQLKLDSSGGSEAVPRPQECVAHLKLLQCFYRLRQKIGSAEGLFGISDPFPNPDIPQRDGDQTDLNKIRAVISEKRWQVYISRAVHRFELWRNSLQPNPDYLTLSDVSSQPSGGKAAAMVKPAPDTKAIQFSPETLPPVDVLMVWHAYMLNPRAYLEDSLREGRMLLWHCPMPWQAIVECIDNETFQYNPPGAAQEHFQMIGLGWENTQDSNSASVLCPYCLTTNTVPWTTCGEVTDSMNGNIRPGELADVESQLSAGLGLADKGFLMQCASCGQDADHDSLCAGRFFRDVKLLIDSDVVLPGTILGLNGIPGKVGNKSEDKNASNMSFPSKLLRVGLGKHMLRLRTKEDMRMAQVRADIEEGLSDKQLVKAARESPAYRLLRHERIAVRRMMSRYWENSSPFSLDLVGAVIRQGSFIEKMHGIDWLHSPALPSTMSRLILKYVRFVNIMKQQDKMAVPTLDVDLAWHTHQLAPSSYLQYTVAETGSFVDHDDKVAETALNDSFAWTSKTYQKLYGEPYSECTCWYCEAVRESHTSAASRLFRTSNASASDAVHSVPSDPTKSVHISAHNAVQPTGDSGRYASTAKAQAADLEKYYQKACHRADKKGQPRPKRNDYYYSDAWGYPVYMPMYAPYMMVGAMYTPGIYPVNPGCMALNAGAAGQCCSGTCGGMVAAGGSCGGMASGACGGAGGAAAGGCGGGSGGGCGGGGGGGGGGGCGGGGGGGC
ncbi:hypothetical protein MBLNU459_g5824t1 [Dothideomycetes sp. NU459]